jgi:hypothetical protein
MTVEWRKAAMRFLLAVVLATGFCLANSETQTQDRVPRYMERAEVNHSTDSATVSASDSRPLAQAVTALSEEYAWTIDFEDPPFYSKHDLVDDTAPEWRAAHPNVPGVTVIGGGGFRTRFPETADTRLSAAEEEHVLDIVVSDYNKSGNPGGFSLINEGNGRFAVVGSHVSDDSGQEEAVPSILDTAITVPTEARNGLQTISAILKALATKSQTRVELGLMPWNALVRTEVTVGGQNIPARALLLQTLSLIKTTLYWRLYYDNDVKTYAFSLLPLRKATNDASGKRTTVLVR